MKRFFLTFLIVTFAAAAALSKEVDVITARKAAVNFITYNTSLVFEGDAGGL